MAVVALKSTAITQADAFALTNPYLSKAQLQETEGFSAVANGDSIGSTYRLARIPSNARMSSVKIFNTAITSGAADVGLYQTAANGGAVVDADFFTAAASIASAAANGTEVAGGNVLSVANREKRIWELLGLAADPNRYYDVALTLTAATTAAGSVAMQVQFVV